ncbi:MAG: DUF433 domain-containing protein, partial [Bacteroidetes bacterium]|nr:DUF433 domain-containing protein [Bacteroidota bacterium]
MLVIETRYEHIILNKRNVPVISGTNIKVIELILDKIAYGWSPEEMRYQHSQLTLGQIYSALAYYSDHQEELDLEIENQLNEVDQMRKETKPIPLIAKLKAKK